jgi:hypothetical protein
MYIYDDIDLKAPQPSENAVEILLVQSEKQK